MTTADYIQEAAQHVKTLNHYQKHALLVSLIDEVSVIINDEVALYELYPEGLNEDVGKKPFSVMCNLEGCVAIAWDSNYKDRPELQTVGKQKRGRKTKNHPKAGKTKNHPKA